MLNTLSSKEEEKRLEDFKRIAENWDKIPERAKGKLEGSTSILLALFEDNCADDKKAG